MPRDRDLDLLIPGVVVEKVKVGCGRHNLLERNSSVVVEDVKGIRGRHSLLEAGEGG